MAEEEEKAHIRWFYRFVQYMVSKFGKIFFRLTITGTEHIPLTGGVIIASNHASYLDPPLIGSIMPREVSFFAKKELFTIPLLRRLLRYTKSIPVDRYGYSASSLKAMMKYLKEGRAVIVFPEGTRTRTGRFLKPKKGVGMAAVMADKPIVPSWIQGSFRAKPLSSKITIHFMPPFEPSEIEAPSKKDHYLLVSQRIMCDIVKMYEKHMAVLNEAKSK